MEFVRVGDFAVQLNGSDALGDLAVDVNIQIFAMLHQQQLIDLITQGVLFALFDGFLEGRSVDTLLLELGFDLLPASLDLAFGNDVAVDLGDDLFDHSDIRGRAYTYKRA